jgi:hypothetical protein
VGSAAGAASDLAGPDSAGGEAISTGAEAEAATGAAALEGSESTAVIGCSIGVSFVRPRRAAGRDWTDASATGVGAASEVITAGESAVGEALAA